MSAREHPPQTSEAYSKCGLMKDVYISDKDLRFNLYFSFFIRFNFLCAFAIILSIYAVHLRFSEKVNPKCLWLDTNAMLQF